MPEVDPKLPDTQPRTLTGRSFSQDLASALEIHRASPPEPWEANQCG